MITSALLVNGGPFTDITQSVAVFKEKDAAIPISFVKPEGLPESVIPAGTYSGTITFDITYSKTP